VRSKNITSDLLNSAYDYDSYNQLIHKLFNENRTTNDDNSESQLNYTKLNIQRASRWEKRAKLNDDLKEIVKKMGSDQIWLVITEGWCGDAAQILPFINKISELNERIELKLILRDQHPEVMDEFLTDGSRSIPKVVVLNKETLEIKGSWGPRPKAIHEDYVQKRRDADYDNKKAAEELHLWYARDKGKTTQEEFKEFLESLN
jgi:thioredoxin-like negative regulator of GroEL